jgi:hypothetical protein
MKLLATAAVLAALTGCSPALDATAWNQDARRCEHGEEREHRNGLWAVSCRDGTGTIVWVVWML